MSILRKLRNFFKANETIKPYIHYKQGKFRYITEFNNGYAMALVSKFNINKNQYMNDIFYISIVNENYDIVMQTPYLSHDDWYNGYIIAFAGSYAVLLDSNLKEVPNTRYNWIGITNNYLEVQKKYNDLITYGLLDENLELILPEIYSLIKPISKSRFFCEGEQNIVFDAVKKQTFELKNVSYIYTEDINGWYKFYDVYDAYGYFDNNFNIVIGTKYTNLGEFDENGFTAFERDGIIGLIDRTGKELIF